MESSHFFDEQSEQPVPDGNLPTTHVKHLSSVWEHDAHPVFLFEHDEHSFFFVNVLSGKYPDAHCLHPPLGLQFSQLLILLHGSHPTFPNIPIHKNLLNLNQHKV